MLRSRYVLIAVLVLFAVASHVGVFAAFNVQLDPAKWSVQTISLSSDGKYLAAILEARVYDNDDWLCVWYVPTGKNLMKLKSACAGQQISHLSWHPLKPILAVSGGRDGSEVPAGYYQGSSGGLMLFDMRTRKKRDVWFDADPGAPIAWMPDGRSVLVAGPGPAVRYYVDNRKVVKPYGLWTTDTQIDIRQVVTSRKGYVVALLRDSPMNELFPKVIVYSHNSKSPNSFKLVKKFEAARKFTPEIIKQFGFPPTVFSDTSSISGDGKFVASVDKGRLRVEALRDTK